MLGECKLIIETSRTKPYEKGGLDFGTVGSSVVLLSILVVLVGMATFYNRKPEKAYEQIAEN